MPTTEDMLDTGDAMAPQNADAMQPKPAVTPQPAPGAIPPTQQPAQAGYGAQLSSAASKAGNAIAETGNDAWSWLKDKARGLTGEKDPMVIDPNVLNDPGTFRKIAGIYMAYGKPEGLKYLEHAMTMQKEGAAQTAMMLMEGDVDGALAHNNANGEIKFTKIEKSGETDKNGDAMYHFYQGDKIVSTRSPGQIMVSMVSPDGYLKMMTESSSKAAERRLKEAEKASDREWEAKKLEFTANRDDKRYAHEDEKQARNLAAIAGRHASSGGGGKEKDVGTKVTIGQLEKYLGMDKTEDDPEAFSKKQLTYRKAAAWIERYHERTGKSPTLDAAIEASNLKTGQRAKFADGTIAEWDGDAWVRAKEQAKPTPINAPANTAPASKPAGQKSAVMPTTRRGISAEISRLESQLKDPDQSATQQVKDAIRARINALKAADYKLLQLEPD